MLITHSACASPGQARRRAARSIAAAGLDVDAQAVEMVVAELISNAVRHTRAGTWSLRMHVVDGALVVEVTDSDRRVPRERTGRHLDGLGGFGLGMVRTLCDRVETIVSPGGKTIRARWPVPQDGAGSRPGTA
ncbi:ATP-binding protein [Streptomyces sp. NPDC088785]|uniref:ATP-binding protein n=1 Tax=Streptomyces sp. NPDC088785 TaxID=3365897 RepID=UPI00381A1497